MKNNNGAVIKLKAFAKLNLFLEILGKRDDGFHELVTVMQEIDLADDIEFEEAESGVSLICDDPDIPIDGDNLICKAANLLNERLLNKKGAKIKLAKRIPVGAGLGGGSSDAAATLKGLNRLWGVGCSDLELMEMGAGIGSDVPFFINGKSAICMGKGDIIKPITVNNEFIYVLIYPNLKISTINIYKNLKLGLTKSRKDVSFFLNQLAKGEPECLGEFLFNRLSETIYSVHPEIKEMVKLLETYKFCGLQISGSGSSLYGLCERRCDAEVIAKDLNKLNMAKVFVVSNCLETS